MARRSSKKPDKQAPSAARAVEQTAWLERVASAVGLLIALAVIVLLARDLARSTGSPPAVRVETGSVSTGAGGFAVEILARNESGAVAAGVEIEGVLRQGTQVVETARVTLDYIPGHSVRRGGLFFTHDPRALNLSVRPLGYAVP